jgi:predicted acyl esterase
MRSLLVAVLFGLVCFAPPASRAEDAPWTAEQTDVAIPMRDGKSLAADVWLPATPGRYPAVVVQTPYSRAMFRASLAARNDTGSWDREHYAYVVADWRGFFGSKKAGRAGPGQLGRDGFDVVEWTAAQPWCDGKVGTWGPSALGRVQLETAAEQPPHLVCCVPLVAPIGQHYDDYYEGGVLREAHVDKLDALGFGAGAIVRAAPLEHAAAWGIAESLDRPERIGVPMFFITGWYDIGTARELDSFRAIVEHGGPKAREGSRLLVGPWTHMALDKAVQGDMSFPAAVGEAARETRLFLDSHLRGATDNGWAARPRVRTWRCNEEGWIAAESWPSKHIARRELRLHANGVIAWLDGPGPNTESDEPARGYVDDPAAPVPTIGGANLPAPHLTDGPRDQASLLGRDDVLVYSTEVLEAPLRMDGAAVLNLWLRSDQPDVDVAVRLCHVLADGRTMLVADGIQRVSQLKSRRVRPLVPGQAMELEVMLPPLAYTFPAGTRLRLLVAGSNWPRYERNPHTGEIHFDPAKSTPANVEILHDYAHAAVLKLAALLPDPAPVPAPK